MRKRTADTDKVIVETLNYQFDWLSSNREETSDDASDETGDDMRQAMRRAKIWEDQRENTR